MKIIAFISSFASLLGINERKTFLLTNGSSLSKVQPLTESLDTGRHSNLSVLDNRIRNISCVIANQTNQIELLQVDMKMVRDAVLPIFGDSFFQMIENDKIWQQVGSSEYIKKYIDHQFPIVADLANHRLIEYNLIQSNIQLRKELIQHIEDRELYTYLPIDLYHKIRQERSEKMRLDAKLQRMEKEVNLRRTQNSELQLEFESLKLELQTLRVDKKLLYEHLLEIRSDLRNEQQERLELKFALKEQRKTQNFNEIPIQTSRSENEIATHEALDSTSTSTPSLTSLNLSSKAKKSKIFPKAVSFRHSLSMSSPTTKRL